MVRRQQGFSLLEGVISILLVACFYGVLSLYLDRLAARTEAAAMDAVVRQLEHQVNRRVAQLYIRGETQKITMLEGQNPFVWFAESPQFYGGEIAGQQKGQLRSKRWYYDTESGHILYLAEYNNYLKIEGNNSRFVQFVLKLKHTAADAVAKRTSLELVIHPVTPYSWF